jgi:hypothetical protein
MCPAYDGFLAPPRSVEAGVIGLEAAQLSEIGQHGRRDRQKFGHAIWVVLGPDSVLSAVE